ncbi:MAG: asparagine synthase (glutamine-hydrolyzing) [Nitrolancea sp.]
MCGICGKWSQNGVSMASLERMAGAIRHRGPDDDGFYLNGRIGLASRRLSIIDLEAGRQPISNEDGSIWIVFNGEVYNYPELRRKLEQRGHQFSTNSDTEVIVHLYEDAGLDFVKQLRGMFALAIYDESAQRLFLARDPLGQKPLYYTRRSGSFAFASEIKSLLLDETAGPRLNPRGMHHLLSLRCIPGSDTLFEGIQKVPAGHSLTLDPDTFTVQQYWDLSYTPKMTGSEDEIRQQLQQLLLETVSCHMLSDVPLGAFLSGGVDSSLIVGLMCSLSETPIKTFSVGVRDQGFNELPYARLVAERYGTDHHELIVEPSLISSLPEMLWHMEEPIDPFAFGVHSVARLASQHVKVVLGGDGGDEIFAGYDRYLGNQIVDTYCLVPRALRHRLVEPLIRHLPDNFGYNNRVQKLRWLMAMSETSDGERYAQSAAFLRFSYADKERLYSDTLWRELSDLDSSAQLTQFFDADNLDNSVDRMLYTDVKTRLADHLLMVADRMTMAHSLECRSPYVDHQMVEFAAHIPADLKLHGRRLKHIQREVARDYLPERLLSRGKQGFSFPLAHWFSHELRDLTTNLLRHSNLVSEGYFRPEAVQVLLDEHISGRVDHNYRLWLLLNLELWHRMFVAGESKDELGELLRTSGAHLGSASGETGMVSAAFSAAAVV